MALHVLLKDPEKKFVRLYVTISTFAGVWTSKMKSKRKEKMGKCYITFYKSSTT